MNFKVYSFVALCATVLLANCSKDGADGKTSLTRTSAEAAGIHCAYGGTKFETGIDANNNATLDDNEVITTQTQYVCGGAGATYSNWIDVNVTTNPGGYVGEGRFEYKQEITANAITADVVNKGIVLMYFKNSAGVVALVDRDDIRGLRDQAVDGSFFEFEGAFLFKPSYISFLVHEMSGFAGGAALVNASGATVRYVIVPGAIAGRSIADLKTLPYSEIAKLYNIQD